MDNIVEHTLRHDKSTKARLLAKIIDREGPQFGKKIKMESKAIQQTLKTDEEAKVSIVQSQISSVKHNPRPQVQC